MNRLTNVSADINDKHIKNIEENHKKPITNSDTNDKADNENKGVETQERTCHKCGSKLVLRIAKSGANAGKQFYGCSAFPARRYTQNV